MIESAESTKLGSSNRGLMGVLLFTLGGALLLLGIYEIIESANKPWIDQGLFNAFFVLPIGLISFFLLGFGLFLLIKSTKKD